MGRYEIAFSGKLVPGAQREVVQANLARLFQADAQRVAMLFSGRRVILKNNLDEAAAEKYRSTLERAGALVEVASMEPEIEEVELAPPPEPEPQVQPVPAPNAAQQAASPGRLKVVPRDEYMAAFVGVDAPDFGIAPVGADLQDAKPQSTAPRYDFSTLSLAPVGSDMGQQKTPPSGPPPDTSHLRLEERK
ncbi:hypothetical protein SA496_18340 [Pseudomonas sp. JS3066]|jgi:hypothetical protein|uniref:hypothetical protein n=1 Tax=unclassified Pseudomonas TaxID=196821 RepID=UPI000EA9BE80|nr:MULTISPECIES: hypothetical protein [unclassified Pseudomonas]AYF85744.1 hypothetical protein D6Z43_00605 [Pseudomonas sp. DY-1]WVK91671.1 hypothetical protein SA496_18340 [Pseudomonas sp. JS3066]